MHFAIFVDAILHVTIIALSILVVYFTCRFIKAVKQHPNTTKGSVRISYGMLPIAGFMVYCSIRTAIECFCQYGQWWSR